MIISTAIKTLFRPSSLIVLIIVILGVVFVHAVPECRAVRSKNIVVVTGDKTRIPKAIEIAEIRGDSRLFISGAGSHDLKLPKNMKIEIETESKTTYENSIAIRDWVLRHGFDDIALITSDYHMWRTLLLVRRQLPFTKVEVCPVESPGMTRRRKLELWITEFGKYIMTMVGVNDKK
ncbi:MAG: YdcF family protein [Rickettsiales bacterium]|jgi:hypothetical protein|nr:YdcF family protein [Rickettsiales bacterium]